jgi:hypothetical protein
LRVTSRGLGDVYKRQVFEGGHESESSSAVLWLARQRKGQPADFSLGKKPVQTGSATEVSK